MGLRRKPDLVVQNDMKRVIAYSTCSQLGYMVFACGLSHYSVGVFHLMNHYRYQKEFLYNFLE